MLIKKKVSNLDRRRKSSVEELSDQMKDYLARLTKLAHEDPETAKIVARVALIKTGVLNEDGTSKENIVDYPPHIGYENDSKPKRRIRK